MADNTVEEQAEAKRYPILRMYPLRRADYNSPLAVLGAAQAVGSLIDHLKTLSMWVLEPEWISAPISPDRAMWGDLPFVHYPELRIRFDLYWNGQDEAGGEFLALPHLCRETPFPTTTGRLFTRGADGSLTPEEL